MESEIMKDEKNVIVMKLLHYFITEKNYNPIILQGVENEIWLENLSSECQIVRIVSGYIHNNEQFGFDKFKTQRIVKKIKKKTLSININVLSIFVNLGDNVKFEEPIPNFFWVKAEDEKELEKNQIIKNKFPDLPKKLIYNEKGVELFMKITKDINKHNQEDSKKVERVFKPKFPTITYAILAINIIIFVIPLLYGQSEAMVAQFCVHGPSIRYGHYYRLFTGLFLHGSIFHLIFNSYALYVIGSQIESFLGKFKFAVIYLAGGVMGSLFSITFNGNAASIGASGAIFGLMGALVYFGYHYRVYLGNVIKSQIIPLIVFNLVLGFVMTGVDNSAHIGGLIGGTLATVALGIKDKSTNFERMNGLITTIIFFAFAIYMAFVYAG
jgi:rhomboid protease GluP